MIFFPLGEKGPHGKQYMFVIGHPRLSCTEVLVGRLLGDDLINGDLKLDQVGVAHGDVGCLKMSFGCDCDEILFILHLAREILRSGNVCGFGTFAVSGPTMFTECSIFIPNFVLLSLTFIYVTSAQYLDVLENA